MLFILLDGTAVKLSDFVVHLYGDQLALETVSAQVPRRWILLPGGHGEAVAWTLLEYIAQAEETAAGTFEVRLAIEHAKERLDKRKHPLGGGR